MPDAPSLRTLQQHTQSVDAALALFYEAGAHHRSYPAQCLPSAAVDARMAAATWPSERDVPDAARAFLDQLASDFLVREADREAAMRAFQRSFDPTAPLLACAVCGVRAFGTDCRPVPIAALEQLRLTEDQRGEYLEQGDARHVLSVTAAAPGSDALYYLHPELVIRGASGTLEAAYACAQCRDCLTGTCSSCRGRLRTGRGPLPPHPPERSVALRDFGLPARLDLPPLTLAERILLSPVRLYTVLKIVTSGSRFAANSARLRGHTIAFPHCGVADALATLRRRVRLPDPASLPEHLHVVFVGPDGRPEDVQRGLDLVRDINVRVDVFYRYVDVWRRLNRHFAATVDIDGTMDTRRALTRVPSVLLERATVIDDATAVALEAVASSDVARVRSGEEDGADAGSSSGSPPQERDGILLTSSLVTAAADHPDSARTHFLNALRRTLGTPQEHAAIAPGVRTAPLRLVVPRSEHPVNEFTDNDVLLYGAFPHLFFTGRGLPDGGRLAPTDIHHLLFQFHNRFAMDEVLIFHLFDQRSRWAVVNRVAALVKANTTAFQRFQEVTSQPGFLQRLERAASDSTEGRRIFQELQPAVNVAGMRVPYSPQERAAAITHILALIHRFGLPSVFMTVSPDDAHHPMSVRLSFPSIANVGFPADPAAAQAFMAAMQRDGVAAVAGQDVREVQLPHRIASNPVAAAYMFRELLAALHRDLFGAPLASETKTSRPYMVRVRGLFGRCAATYFVVEAQGRGTLHVHLLFWGGMPPDVVAAVAAYPALLQRVREVLDSMFVAQLPVPQHILGMARRINRQRPQRTIYVPTPILTADAPASAASVAFTRAATATLDNANVHVHCETCTKPPLGQRQCRMCRPAPEAAQTDVVQLMPLAGTQRGYEVAPVAQERGLLRPRGELDPLPVADSRILVIELQRGRAQLPAPLRDDDLQGESVQRALAILTAAPPHLGSPLPTGLFEREATLRRLRLAQAEAALWQDAVAAYAALEPEQRARLQQMLPLRNGYVVETSDTLAVLTGSNTCCYPLGAQESARATVAYTIKYMTKDAVKVSATVALLHEARRRIEDYPSIAADTGTEQRTARHYLAHILNRYQGLQELSAQQAASELLGLPSQGSTETFTYVFARAALAETRPHFADLFRHGLPATDDDPNSHGGGSGRDSHNKERALGSNGADGHGVSGNGVAQEEPVAQESDYDASTDDDDEAAESRNSGDDEVALDSFLASAAMDDAVDGGHVVGRRYLSSGSGNRGGATIYRSGGRFVPATQLHLYEHRGPELEALSLYEYAAIVGVRARRGQRDDEPSDADTIASITSTDESDAASATSSASTPSNDGSCSLVAAWERRKCGAAQRRRLERQRLRTAKSSEDETVASSLTPTSEEDTAGTRRPMPRRQRAIGRPAAVVAPRPCASTPPAAARPGRAACAVFPFDPGCALADSHEQYLRARQSTPIIAGMRPPRYPGAPPTNPLHMRQWQRAATLFAAFVAVVFIPWSPDTGGPRRFRSWQELGRFLVDWETGGSFVNAGRATVLRNIANALVSRESARTILSLHRSRNATVWARPHGVDDSFLTGGRPCNDGEGTSGDSAAGHNAAAALRALEAANHNSSSLSEMVTDLLLERGMLDDGLEHAIRSAAARKLDAAAKCVNDTVTAFNELAAEVDATVHAGDDATADPATAGATAMRPRVRATQMRRAQTMLARLRRDVSVEDVKQALEEERADIRRRMPPAVHAAVNAAPAGRRAQAALEQILAASMAEGREASEEQKAVLRPLARHLDDPIGHPLPRLLVLGGPGMGKTALIRWIRLLAVAVGKDVLCTAFTGAAASNVDGAWTCHTGLKLGGFSDNGGRSSRGRCLPLTPNVLALLQAHFSDRVVLIIDEVSMLAAWLISRVEQRAREGTGCTSAFGGLPVIFLGDFYQLPPVGDKSLTEAALHADAGVRGYTEEDVRGAALFRDFRLVRLRRQYRSRDPAHTARLERLRQLRDDDASPVTPELLQFLRSRVLTKERVRADPSILDETILVSSNAERHAINYAQARRRLHRGGVLVTWDLIDLASGVADADVAARLRDGPFSAREGFMGMFMQGEPVMCRRNVNAVLGYVNGADGVFDSLSFEGYADVWQPGDTESLEAKLTRMVLEAPPGTEVHLPYPPTTVWVELTRLSPVQLAAWPAEATAEAGRVVVPVEACTEKAELKYVSRSTGKLKRVSFSVRRFQCELAYAITFYKIQGKERDRIILLLNKRTGGLKGLDYHSLLVGLSRVFEGSGIFVYPLPPGQGLDHLAGLAPKPTLRAWLAGFEDAALEVSRRSHDSRDLWPLHSSRARRPRRQGCLQPSAAEWSGAMEPCQGGESTSAASYSQDGHHGHPIAKAPPGRGGCLQQLC
jgi:hypothetical protein